MQENSGISVAILTHNGARRLPAVLAHLAGQVPGDGLSAEVIVVDNGSSDDSGACALRNWPANAGMPLRVVREEKLGVAWARKRAMAEVRYPVVAFVDDDNLLEPGWVRRAWEVMEANPRVAACGGRHLPPGGEKPAWFHRYHGAYAIGAQGIAAGDVTTSRGYLWGAGLVLRRTAWEQLIQGGFRFRIAGRQGTNAGCGEDSELCYALRLAGWRLRYEPALRLKHEIAPERRTREALRHLARGFGAGRVYLSPYRVLLGGGPRTLPSHWLGALPQAATAVAVAMARRTVMQLRGRDTLDASVEQEKAFGALQAVLSLRGRYAKTYYEVEELARKLAEGPR
ncbi:MAG: glycosyltransferase [Gammaproteobacteria bacterium]|nr:glycosyltransferase [Gammaproteobacteria bacterium]